MRTIVALLATALASPPADAAKPAVPIATAPASVAAASDAPADNPVLRYCRSLAAHSGARAAAPVSAQESAELAQLGVELQAQAEAGDAQAQYIVGLVIGQRARRLAPAGRGEDVDALNARAQQWFEAAAAAGFPLAQYAAYETHPTSGRQEDAAAIRRYLLPAALNGVQRAVATLWGKCIANDAAAGLKPEDCIVWRIVLSDVKMLVPPDERSSARQFSGETDRPPDMPASLFEKAVDAGRAQAVAVARNRDRLLAQYPMLRACGYF